MDQRSAGSLNSFSIILGEKILLPFSETILQVFKGNMVPLLSYLIMWHFFSSLKNKEITGFYVFKKLYAILRISERYKSSFLRR